MRRFAGFVDCKPQWDLVGGDLPGVPLADLTMEECLARCRDNADCEQIVYGVGASGLDCYLKSISGNDGNTGPDASVIASCVKGALQCGVALCAEMLTAALPRDSHKPWTRAADVPDCTSELNDEYCLTCGTTNSWRLTCLSTGTPCRATFTAVRAAAWPRVLLLFVYTVCISTEGHATQPTYPPTHRNREFVACFLCGEVYSLLHLAPITAVLMNH